MPTIDDFKGKFVGGGARPNQFEVTLTWPTAVSSVPDAPFFIKTASLPGPTIGEVAVEYRGRTLYVAGDRSFEQWSTTVINDETFAIRNAIEQWMNLIHSIRNNTGEPNISNYVADLSVTQYGRAGSAIKTQTIRNCWPVAISAIELNWDTRDTIETFDVTWRYTDFQGTGEAAFNVTAGQAAVTDAAAGA